MIELARRSSVEQNIDDKSGELSNYGISALDWYGFGFRVIPVLASSGEYAVDNEQWFGEYSEEAIRRHWSMYPEHEVGFIPDDETLVLTVAAGSASKALYAIEKALGALPNMYVRTPSGAQYFFRLGDGVCATSSAHVSGSDCIGISTGRALVILPTSDGGEMVTRQAANVGELTVASQAFVDAVLQHNASIAEATAAGGADLAVSVTTPAPASAISAVAGPEKGGKAGEGGGTEYSATIPAAGAVEGGKAGEGGGQASADAAFTAFAGPSLGEECDDAQTGAPAANPAISQDGQGEGGEDGALAVASPKVDTGELAARYAGGDADDVLTPKAAENPVVAALKTHGLYRTPLGSGKHSLACPWAQEHSAGSQTSATYAEPDTVNATGVYCCPSAHPQRHTTLDLLEYLGVPKMDARHKPVIRVVNGDLHRVTAVAEGELAKLGTYFQSGGLIVFISTDPNTGDPAIVPINASALTRALSESVSFEKYDGRSKGWVPCDPPTRHVSILYNAQVYPCLPSLAGVARQPYISEADGVLVTEPGYDNDTKRFGVFAPGEYVIPQSPTKEMALAALAKLEDLLIEFRFAYGYDKAAALSAIFTATVRTSLAHAPAYHVKAAVIGSGKSFLCELISAFAGPASSAKVSYPSTSDEATKAMLSLLLKNPAVIEFDDMTSDWIPHGVINRMLTAEYITDRVLGVSKTATVSTRTMFLSSGNNVGPVRDLLRRVVTINIDPQCATPATIAYKGNPVDAVRQNRGAYVAAVLTIILASRQAGSPRTDVNNIATYGGAWADYCRHPLIWLGLPDPATSLLEQVKHDPDSDALGALLTEWYKVFCSKPTTVRRVIEAAGYQNDPLQDAIQEFPVVERGSINPSKLGWLLKRNANRIVGGLKFVEDWADGRKAWSVVVVNPGAIPPAASPRASAPDLDPDDTY